jgi:hypothetical protein
MDGRQVDPKTCERRPHEATPQNYVLTQRFRMMGSHEHDLLVAEGHYRCPCCRRADTMETSGTGISRR